ncbi:MAG: VWA domain-containing protein [Chitinophagaceae bacterium]|nr:VWA domain-containing protein [Chitinophagaceae bacterium]
MALKTIFIILFLGAPAALLSQHFYQRGEVKDENGRHLQNVSILQHSTGLVYRSGYMGAFGIICKQPVDTFTFYDDGFLPEKKVLHADEYARIYLKYAPKGIAKSIRGRLSSQIKDFDIEDKNKWVAGGETYLSLIENHFIEAKKNPHIGISLNMDKASYSNIRRFINNQSMVPPDAVRIEEMLNYFNLNYHQPPPNQIFHYTTRLTECPWNGSHYLYYLNLYSQKLNLDSLPPSHLVFLIDISASMDMPNRLPLIKSAFRLLVQNLRARDSVSIVVYGGITAIMLHPTSGAEKEKILKVIDSLEPGGFTPGESGIRLAYSLAKKHFIHGGNNRIILATDGDFNVGVKTEQELEKLVLTEKAAGIYLSCLGVGMGNYKDSKIQVLAQKGNGNFAYLDNIQEAEKVLLREFTNTLYAVADDVYMNLKFNPEFVKEYRIIGFENTKGVLKDTSSVLEGCEMGSGVSLMVMIEIIPTQAAELLIRQQKGFDHFSSIEVHYKLPHQNEQRFVQFHDTLAFCSFSQLEQNYRFASAVAMFGSLLRNSEFVKITWDYLLAHTRKHADLSEKHQHEFLELVNKAKDLYTAKKKKKKKKTSVTEGL